MINQCMLNRVIGNNLKSIKKNDPTVRILQASEIKAVDNIIK